MNKTKIVLGAMITLAVALTMSSVGILQAKGNPHRVIVTFEEGTILNEKAIAKAGAELVKELHLVNGAVVTLPSQAAVKGIYAISGVKNVEPDVAQSQEIPLSFQRK